MAVKTNTSTQRRRLSRRAHHTPLGDIHQIKLALADIARDFVGESACVSPLIKHLLRWVPESHLTELHARLIACGLAEPGAESIVGITSCPGTDTCNPVLLRRVAWLMFRPGCTANCA